MKPEDILDYCLKEIEAGRKTPTECAALYPNVPNLEAQLLAARALRQLDVLTLRPEASRQIEARLRQKLRAQKPAAARQRTSTLRWALPLALTISLLFGMVGTVAASADSVPGNVLYPVKRAGETVQVVLTPASEQASLHTSLAQRRLDEIIALSELGNVDSNLLSDLTTETETALNAVENTPADEHGEVVSGIILLTERQQAVLATVKASAPSQAQAGLTRAIEASSHNHGIAQGHLKQGPPGSSSTVEATRIPPGQAKKTETAPTDPNCTANNPNSPNYCTPTSVSNSATPSLIVCGTPNGQSTKNSKCKATKTPCPAEKPGRGSKCK
jgi:hypothetical protein